MLSSLDVLRKETIACRGRWWRAYERLCGPGIYDDTKRGIYVDDDFEDALKLWQNVGEYWRPRDDSVVTLVYSDSPPKIQMFCRDILICLRASSNGTVKWRIENDCPRIQARMAENVRDNFDASTLSKSERFATRA